MRSPPQYFSSIDSLADHHSQPNSATTSPARSASNGVAGGADNANAGGGTIGGPLQVRCSTSTIAAAFCHKRADRFASSAETEHTHHFIDNFDVSCGMQDRQRLHIAERRVAELEARVAQLEQGHA